MKNENYAWKYLFLLAVLGCSESKKETGIEFEIKKPSSSLFEMASDPFNVYTTPSTLNDFNCIGILAGHTDGEGNKGNCTTSLGDILPVSRWDGLVSYSSNTTSTLSVNQLRPGEARIALVGFVKPTSATACADINSDFSPEDDGYSDPFLLATKDINLNAGPNSSTLLAEFDSSNTIDECDDSIWDESATETASTLENSLIAFWDLEDATDSSPEAHDFTASGTVAYVAGKIGNALTLDDSTNTGYLSAPDNASLDVSTGETRTISFWIYISGTPGVTNVVKKTPSAPSSGPGWGITLSGSSQLRLDFNDGGDATIDSQTFSTCTPASAAWNMVVIKFTSDASTAPTLEIKKPGGTDCSENGTAFTEYPNTGNSENLKLGPFQITGTMMLDALGIWSRHLTTDEVTELYNGSAGKGYGNGF